jgi:hypothetical protein
MWNEINHGIFGKLTTEYTEYTEKQGVMMGQDHGSSCPTEITLPNIQLLLLEEMI